METPGLGQTGPVEPALEETTRKFNEAFNRGDPDGVSSFWVDDGTLIDPGGRQAWGRSNVATLFEENMRTFLAGTVSTFTIRSVRPLGTGYAFLDMEHELQGFRMPDGTRQLMRLHVAMLARKEGNVWKWVDARPHAYLPQPPALH